MMKITKAAGVIVLFVCYVIGLLGCTAVLNTAKGIIGISTKELDAYRPKAIKKTVNCEYKACYDKTIEVLEKMGAYIYAKDKKKNLIAVYLSRTDTTAAGIYFTIVDSADTQIEISSPSVYAKELIAQRLFSYLEKNE